MKAKYLVCASLIFLGLTSCEKKEETYQGKNVKVESVFDSASKDSPKDKKPEKKPVNPAPPKEEKQAKKKYKTVDFINLRKTPTTQEDNIIASLSGGKVFEVLEEKQADDGVWIKVSFEGKEGYLKKDLLEEVK